MTKSEMQMWDYSLVGPAMLFFNQYFSTFINEYIVLWLALVSFTFTHLFLKEMSAFVIHLFNSQIWVTLDLLIYCYRVCHEICAYLRVELFRIPYPGGPLKAHEPPSASEKNGTKSHSKPKIRSNTKPSKL